jgi:hypothetical protein
MINKTFGAPFGACGVVSFLGVDWGIVFEMLPENSGVAFGSFVTTANSQRRRLEVPQEPDIYLR